MIFSEIFFLASLIVMICMTLNNEIIVLNDSFATTSTVKLSICSSAAYINCMLLALYHELQ